MERVESPGRVGTLQVRYGETTDLYYPCEQLALKLEKVKEGLCRRAEWCN
jgi:hypothetical protein